MNRREHIEAHLVRWTMAALLAMAAAPVLFLPVLLGGDVITWPSVLAAGATLTAALILVMYQARRRTFRWMVILSPVVFVAAVVMHNLEYAVTGIEEPAFLLVAILGGPALLLTGLAGLVWTAIRDRHAPHAGGGAAPHPV
jgi:hypothetical protein